MGCDPKANPKPSIPIIYGPNLENAIRNLEDSGL